MFDSLDEQMKIDESKVTSSTERLIRYLLVALVTILVFGGLYFGIHLMQGS